ncbi:MAG TPA: glycosyltransferase [Roseiflexaceae bacterium]|nr:glycosyltransferase [Roseiflexaceae bacterium]
MPAVAYIVRSFPRLSQTFILNEILALEARGVPLRIFAVTDPREPLVQPQAAEVLAPVRYLDVIPAEELRAARLDLARRDPRRYAETVAYVQSRPDLDDGYTASSRYACLDQAIVLASMLARSGDVGHLHAHFAHDPALIALLAHKLTGIPFSFTAHARDLFQIPRHILVERAAAATALVTCCGANLAYLDEVLPPELRARVQLIHHGVNLEGFRPADRPAPSDSGAAGAGMALRASGEAPSPAGEDAAPLILSVGRLVEKKGFPDLLEACALLMARGRRFRCAIFGDGPLRTALAAQVERLGLAGVVELAGERPQRDLVPVFQRADIFALASFVTEDGDRDGVPNVLAEAMACGLPVVSTAVAGIPELVRHGANGLLCPARDVEALAAALARLLDDEGERRAMGAQARRTVVESFDMRAAAARLAGLFAQPMPVAA